MPTLEPETDEGQLVADLARDVVAEQAPYELPFFNAVSVAYFERPDEAFRTRRKKDEALGFGTDALAALTPFALAVASPVIKYLMEEVGKAVKTKSQGIIATIVRRLFRRGDNTANTAKQGATLSAEQLTMVRRLALEKGLALQLPESQASLLADSIVGRLSLAT